MKVEDFEKELNTLKRMFPVYCRDKHSGQIKKVYRVPYGGEVFQFEVELCEQCHNLFAYAVERLAQCPHDPKPRCRKCPNPCYERDKYAKMARVMRYAGVKLGLSKVKEGLKRLLGGSP